MKSSLRLGWCMFGLYAIIAVFTLSFAPPTPLMAWRRDMGRITPITMVLHDRCVDKGQPIPPVDNMDCPDTINSPMSPTTLKRLLKNKTNLIVMEGDVNRLNKQNQIIVKISWTATLNGVPQKTLATSLPDLINYRKSKTGRNGGDVLKGYDSATGIRTIKWFKYYDKDSKPEPFNRTWLQCTARPSGYTVNIVANITSGVRKNNADALPSDERFEPDDRCKDGECTQTWTFQQ